MSKELLWVVGEDGSVVYKELLTTTNPKVYVEPVTLNAFFQVNTYEPHVLGEDCFFEKLSAYMKALVVMEERMQEMYRKQDGVIEVIRQLKGEKNASSGC